jgi:hypothetical protein
VFTRAFFKEPKLKQKTIENIIACNKNFVAFISPHHHLNLIDVQQGRFAQQWHTTQNSPIRKAIHRLNNNS